MINKDVILFYKNCNINNYENIHQAFTLILLSASLLVYNLLYYESRSFLSETFLSKNDVKSFLKDLCFKNYVYLISYF
jgi:hypothetical protein